MLICVAVNLGCTGNESPLPGVGATTMGRFPIVGLAPQDEPTADASDLTTRDIAGAVGFIWAVDSSGKKWNRCSATLIAPSILLTAAHCAESSPTKASFAQSPEEFDIIDIKIHPGYFVEGLEADLALLWLDRPVPTEIVRHYPKIFLGRIDQALRDGPGVGFSDDGLIVGYGWNIELCYDVENCPGDSFYGLICDGGNCTLYMGSAGVRRSGIARDVFIAGSHLAQESRETQEETVAPGDSGGPLFLRAGAQSEYYIAGVASWITWRGTNQERAYWATTGSLEVWQWSVSSDGLARPQSVLDSANAEWLLSTLGGDADADGVPDEIDNCATRRCVRLGWDRDRCFNPLQEDEDGDIVGDACDTCPPSRCDWIRAHAALSSSAALFSCKNPDEGTGLQPDYDGDHIGDQCDLCPRDFTTRLTDSDHDLIGDECDDCPDFPNAPTPCVEDRDCADSLMNSCIPIDEISSIGRCEDPHDIDRDYVPNACDNCWTIANRDQKNSNHPAEIGVLPEKPNLGDLCEEAPLFRLNKQTPDVLSRGLPYVPNDVKLPVQGALDGNAAEATSLSGSSWFSNGLQSTSTFSDPVVFRYCGCYRDGKLVEHNECDAPCDASLAYEAKSGSGWHPAVVEQNGERMPGGILQEFHKGVAGPFTAANWNWFPHTQDTQDPLPTHPWEGYPQLFEAKNGTPVATRVRLASAVLNWQRNLSARDYDTQGRLRAVFVPYDLPKIEEAVEYKIPVARCKGFGCNIWLRWWDAYINPGDFRVNIPDVVLLGRDVEKGRWLLGSPNGHVLEGERAIGRVGEIVDSFATYLTPAESGALLRARGIPSQMLFVSRSAVRPHLIGFAPEGLVVDSAPAARGADDEEFSKVQVPEGGAAVFSATERTLIIVGGAGPADMGIVRRYHIDSDQFEGLSFGPSGPAADVRGVAYDAFARVLYTLEVEEKEGTAQVKSYDFRTRVSRLEWAAPSGDSGAWLGLGIDPRGHLLLVRAFEDAYSVWRTVTPASAEVRFGTVATGEGYVLDHPIPGDDESLLPVRERGADSPTLVPLYPRIFRESAPCCESL